MNKINTEKHIHIHKPTVETKVHSLGTVLKSEVTRVSCDIDMINNTSSRRTIWFEVCPQYGEMLCTDVCDPYVVGLLMYCLKNGLDIISDIPMSEELYYNIIDYLIPALVKTDPRLKEITISCQLQKNAEFRNKKKGTGIGTSISCGVDSLHSIYKYYSHPSSEFKLTHVCLNNVGAFNGIYGIKEKIDAVRVKQYQRSKQAADELNLQLVETDSNFADAFIQNHLLTHTYSSMFAVFMLGSLWEKYYYPSSGHDYTKFCIKDNSIHDSADYEVLSLNFLSTKKLRIYSEGADCTRVQKIINISDFEIAKKYLYSCTSSPENCGTCEKCLRNLYTLDAIGKLKDFEKVYDIKKYQENQKKYIVQLINRKDTYAQDINALYLSTGHNIYANCLDANNKLEEAIGLYEKGVNISEQIAVIEKYSSYSNKAQLILYRHYNRMPGIQDKEKAFEYLSQAFKTKYPDAIITMIEHLSNSIEESKRHEAFELCLNTAESGGSRAQFLLGKMYLDGTIVPKDRELALKWLRSSSAKNNPEAHIVLIDTLLAGTNSLEWKEAFELCSKIANAGGPRAQYRLGKMYLDGAIVPKDRELALKWLRSSSAKNNPEAHIVLIDTLLAGTNSLEWKEAFELCSKIANAGGPRAQYRLSIIYLTEKGVKLDTTQSCKYLKMALSHGDRINWFTDYIFTLRSKILSQPETAGTVKRQLIDLYFTLLEEHGSWIGLRTFFEDKPIFPHGLMSIFISDSARIGKGCTIYQQVTIGSNKINNHPKNGAPRIGNNVLIGAGSQIIGKVSIGDNVKIGAGSTVAQDIVQGATIIPEMKIIVR